MFANLKDIKHFIAQNSINSLILFLLNKMVNFVVLLTVITEPELSFDYGTDSLIPYLHRSYSPRRKSKAEPRTKVSRSKPGPECHTVTPIRQTGDIRHVVVYETTVHAAASRTSTRCIRFGLGRRQAVVRASVDGLPGSAGANNNCSLVGRVVRNMPPVGRRRRQYDFAAKTLASLLHVSGSQAVGLRSTCSSIAAVK